MGNDFLSKVNLVRHILCPSTDACVRYNDILSACIEIVKSSDDKVEYILALGATAKSLALDLFNQGHGVIDIENVDLEYECFLAGTTEKIELAKQKIIGREANIEAWYEEYDNPIV